MSASLGVFVRVRAGIDIVTREATWEFQALDPITGNVYSTRIMQTRIVTAQRSVVYFAYYACELSPQNCKPVP